MTRQPIAGDRYPIIVVGGGVAGVAAAVAAARSGIKTLLVEKAAALGGLATIGLINWWEPLCNAQGKKLISGISEEILRRTIRCCKHRLPAEWQTEGVWEQATDKRFVTHFSPTVLSLVLLDMLTEAGVHVRFDTLATYPEMDGDRVCGILCETVSGTEYYPCDCAIDATGTCILFDRAGAPCRDGQNYMSYYSHVTTFEEGKTYDMLKLRGWHVSGSGMTGKGQPEGFPLLAGTSSDDVNRYLICGQKLLLDELREKDPLGQEVIALPLMPQFRMIRHIVGDYELSMDDLYKPHEDSIGTCGYFGHTGYWFELPYRTLYVPKFENLFAAGRVIAATGDAWDAVRVIPVACETGEAAARAAALCVKEKIAARDVDVGKLQGILRENNFRIHFDDKL
ncbi:MAG: FAD-dependent oxidoreductase [Clostridia bacterium]|nr:FAD-dependent oxidoreductase [Clostridia bacterium]